MTELLAGANLLFARWWSYPCEADACSEFNRKPVIKPYASPPPPHAITATSTTALILSQILLFERVHRGISFFPGSDQARPDSDHRDPSPSFDRGAPEIETEKDKENPTRQVASQSAQFALFTHDSDVYLTSTKRHVPGKAPQGLVRHHQGLEFRPALEILGWLSRPWRFSKALHSLARVPKLGHALQGSPQAYHKSIRKSLEDGF
ncbi:hypothetical protein F5887DRAFT_1164937 [Amanita rubescens]|nr:hypothetical protein F5887DRAFT_1164937 [Amanita rubescens]